MSACNNGVLLYTQRNSMQLLFMVSACLASWPRTVNEATASSYIYPCGGELRTQKFTTHPLRTQSSNVLPFEPGTGPYIALHATPTAKDFCLANFLPFRPIHLHLFQNFSRVCPPLASADTGFCVIHQNKTGHPVHRYRQLMQVPVLSTREM